MRGWAELTFSDLGLFMAVRGIRIARGGAFGGGRFHVMLEEMFHERAAVQFLVVGTVRGGTLQKPVQCSKTRLFDDLHACVWSVARQSQKSEDRLHRHRLRRQT